MSKDNPKEVPGLDNHFEIPGYSRYAITIDGKVLNIETNTYLEGSVNPDGYHNFRLTSDENNVLTWGRHRLMAFVFKHPGVPIEDLIVNHENGIKGDDYLDNLEWMTYQGNQEHAGQMGLTEKCMPISVRDVDTGEVINYPSIIAYARIVGMTKDAVNYRIKAGEFRVFPERKQYRLASVKNDWIIPNNIETHLLTNGTCKKVQVKFLRSDTVFEFDKLTDLAKYLNVSPSTITLWVNQFNQPVLPGCIQLKWSHDPTPWREVLDHYAELEQYTKKRCVKIVHMESKLQFIYESITACATAMKLGITTLHYRLKSKGSVIYPDGYTYCYYSDSL